MDTNDLTYQAKRYLGYAEDIHFDNVYVNETTFEVGFQSRHDNTRLPDCKYYSICDLIERDGLWFKVDKKSIEVIVQTYFPCERVKKFVDEAVNCIRDFLIKERPTQLHSCKLGVGKSSLTFMCFDESVENAADETSLEECIEDDWEDFEALDTYALSSSVSITSEGYKISTDKLTKLALEYIDVTIDQ